MSVLGDLIIAAVKAAEADKPAILAELQKHDGAIEELIMSAVKTGISNPLVASLVLKFLPQALKDLPQMEAAAFDSLVILATKEASTI